MRNVRGAQSDTRRRHPTVPQSSMGRKRHPDEYCYNPEDGFNVMVGLMSARLVKFCGISGFAGEFHASASGSWSAPNDPSAS